jgi:hypothetical protein
MLALNMLSMARASTVMMLLGTCAEASAGCHAADFSVDRIVAIGNEVNTATANLKALQDAPGLKVGDTGLLALAVQMTDRSAVEVALFAGYLTIYSRLDHADDRSATDRLIESSAATSAQSLKGYADYLTVIATGVPQFGAEIRDARDRVRKLQGLFACVIGTPEH